MTAFNRLDKPDVEAGGLTPWPLLALAHYDRVPDGDEALAHCAQSLQGAGHNVLGVVQSNRPRPDRRKCDMVLQNLATGEEICISADRGDEARGCRLDHAALAQATVWAEQALTDLQQLRP